MSSSTSSAQLDKKIFNSDLYTRIHDLWFTDCPLGSTAPTFPTLQKWFGIGSPEQKAAFDDLCRNCAGEALASISPEKLPLSKVNSFDEEKENRLAVAEPLTTELGLSGTKTPEEFEEAATASLSLMLLLDQLPRNLYRTQETLPVVFNHYDRLGRSLLTAILAQPPHLRVDLAPKFRLSPAHRLWFYMPLMHSEDMGDHETFEGIFNEFEKEIAGSGDEGAVQYLSKCAEAEKGHLDILKRFGRYPHRNEALKRESTKEEKEYLESGQTFALLNKKDPPADAAQAG